MEEEPPKQKQDKMDVESGRSNYRNTDSQHPGGGQNYQQYPPQQQMMYPPPGPYMHPQYYPPPPGYQQPPPIFPQQQYPYPPPNGYPQPYPPNMNQNSMQGSLNQPDPKSSGNKGVFGNFIMDQLSGNMNNTNKYQ